MDGSAENEIDISLEGKEAWLVQVPAHIAQQWLESDANENFGNIRFVPGPIPNKPTIHFSPYVEPNSSYTLVTRPIKSTTYLIEESADGVSIQGKVGLSLELKMTAPSQQQSNLKVKSPPIISIKEARLANDAPATSLDISMAWAQARKVDSKGIADKFEKRPKQEVVSKLIEFFTTGSRFTFDEINNVVQQPRTHLMPILEEYTTTETESGRKYYKLRPEFASE